MSTRTQKAWKAYNKLKQLQNQPESEAFPPPFEHFFERLQDQYILNKELLELMNDVDTCRELLTTHMLFKEEGYEDATCDDDKEIATAEYTKGSDRLMIRYRESVTDEHIWCWTREGKIVDFNKSITTLLYDYKKENFFPQQNA